jgi:hypothetical protein
MNNRLLAVNKSLEALGCSRKESSVENRNSLTSKCVRCFNVTVTPAHIIPLCGADCNFTSVQKLVYEYTAEVNNVKPVSLELFKDICGIVMLEYVDLLWFEYKSTKMEDTKYSTILCTPSGKKFIHITGETDATMLYSNQDMGR